ncbi:PLP-dependent aminotransferase family protein [Rhodococcus sp. ABRD24]|uniref:MocR-like pyridoxine biosynthesis transcription factor PdxR n=1 Tax=Rhodococcus sp. ABRD24 TaxID=2507582 RepID=UPI001039DFD4|nr:PLP-dependent aminotransferase family protein [Rhodococcus sp. ABRD24]QBJ95581.1 PLP-dependent aminotransferase family protein [Rhodococcus sp. ABRD24]
MPEDKTNSPRLGIEWNRSSGHPSLTRQLEQSLRAAVRRGQLPTGARLPATRVLADQLGCSRWVVVQAYEQLVAEGYFVSSTGSGTYVQAIAPTRDRPRQPEFGNTSWRYDFGAGTPDLSLFPRHEWLAAAKSALAAAPTSAFDYGPASGIRDLRAALAAYLGRVRGVVAVADDLVITNGAVHAVSVMARTLHARGFDRIAVEHPGWIPLRAPFDGSGLDPIAVGVDDEGLMVTDLIKSGARAVLVAPAHQFPTGSVMSPRRRAALIEWAEAVDGVIIEDDYDSEFRYDRHPLAAIQGMCPERVVLIGSVSKSLAPALRIGWMVLPPQWRDLALDAVRAIDPSVSAISQLTFAEYLSSGGFERHLRRMRKEYANRRQQMVAAMLAFFPNVDVRGISAGLHLMADLGAGSVSEFTELSARRQVRIYPVSRYCMSEEVPIEYRDRRSIVLGYGAIPAHRILKGIETLAMVASEL